MAKHTKRSVIPIYLIGVVWLVYALLFPLRTASHYLICGALSLVAFVAGKAIFPDKVYEMPGEKKTEAPKAEKKTEAKPAHSPEIQALIKERDRALSEMRRLNDAIADEKISAQIDHLEEVTGKIINHVVAHPKKLSQIRRFMDYYLPTTLKLLNSYDRMSDTGVSGENIDGTLAKVEGMMRTIVAAFEKQLDGLYGAEALDISADITVLETMMAREGLTGQPLQADAVQTDPMDIKLEL